MKNALLPLFFLAGLAFSPSAQAQKEETLAGSARVKGGFGAPFFTFSQADDNAGFGGGGGGAFIINDFFIGGFGEGASFGNRRYNNRNYDLSLGYGGFWLGYTYPSHKLIHLYSSLKIGWGNASQLRADDDPFDGDQINDHIFALHPELGAEINLVHWFRLGFTAGFRLVGGVGSLPTVRSGDFNSPTLGITLRFGKFGYR